MRINQSACQHEHMQQHKSTKLSTAAEQHRVYSSYFNFIIFSASFVLLYILTSTINRLHFGGNFGPEKSISIKYCSLQPFGKFSPQWWVDSAIYLLNKHSPCRHSYLANHNNTVCCVQQHEKYVDDIDIICRMRST